jgi:pilus assembly protein CpaD
MMPRRLPTRSRNLAAFAGLAALIGACAPDRAVTGSIYPHDHHARHPIVLADGPRNLDVFIVGSGVLNPRQREDVRAFATEYRRHGQGPMTAQIPSGGRTDAFAHRALDSIRATMEETGVPAAVISVSSYAVADPAVASTIRLSFQRLQAKVASKCGLWPQDLGGSDPRFNFGNQPYWNLGCATQSNLARQVADPIDLARGRIETHGDTLRRVKDIQDLRDGKDPSTVYRQDDQNRINRSVGN